MAVAAQPPCDRRRHVRCGRRHNRDAQENRLDALHDGIRHLEHCGVIELLPVAQRELEEGDLDEHVGVLCEVRL